MTKLTLADVNEALDHQISEGSEYQWHCYGPNARYLDFTIDGFDVTASVIHDTVTQEIYEACLCDSHNDVAYRWSNPDFYKAHAKESKKRGIDSTVAWDDVKYQEVNVDEWIHLALELMENADESTIEEEELIASMPQWHDDEIADTTVQLELPDDELLKLCLLAHERDVTLNQMVNIVLREYIEEYGTN